MDPATANEVLRAAIAQSGVRRQQSTQWVLLRWSFAGAAAVAVIVASGSMRPPHHAPLHLALAPDPWFSRSGEASASASASGFPPAAGIGVGSRRVRRPMGQRRRIRPALDPGKGTAEGARLRQPDAASPEAPEAPAGAGRLLVVSTDVRPVLNLTVRFGQPQEAGFARVALYRPDGVGGTSRTEYTVSGQSSEPQVSIKSIACGMEPGDEQAPELRPEAQPDHGGSTATSRTGPTSNGPDPNGQSQDHPQ
jgi:hypothetical protein